MDESVIIEIPIENVDVWKFNSQNYLQDISFKSYGDNVETVYTWGGETLEALQIVHYDPEVKFLSGPLQEEGHYVKFKTPSGDFITVEAVAMEERYSKDRFEIDLEKSFKWIKDKSIKKDMLKRVML